MVDTKTVLVTGITGQDGSWLADQLSREGHMVHGIVRRKAAPAYRNIEHLIQRDAVRLHTADLCDAVSIAQVVDTVQPDEVYNLAAQSHVGTSFDQPDYTTDVNYAGAVRVFRSVRQHAPQARVYQASTSEMYGDMMTDRLGDPLTLDDKMRPVSPYGRAKLAAHQAAQQYRDAHGMYIACGVLFNHESERRGERFVTRKITKHLAEIQRGLRDELELGNLEAVRDWGYAPEYVDGMTRMLDQPEPDDYVLATGTGYSVKDFLNAVWEHAAIGREFHDVVSIHEKWKRPTDIPVLVGDPSKARDELGWAAETGFDQLAMTMYNHDLAQARHRSTVQGEE